MKFIQTMKLGSLALALGMMSACGSTKGPTSADLEKRGYSLSPEAQTERQLFIEATDARLASLNTQISVLERAAAVKPEDKREKHMERVTDLKQDKAEVEERISRLRNDMNGYWKEKDTKKVSGDLRDVEKKAAKAVTDLG